MNAVPHSPAEPAARTTGGTVMAPGAATNPATAPTHATAPGPLTAPGPTTAADPAMDPTTAADPAMDPTTAADLAVEKIVHTCLYEGYLLWPYRRSALKNARRWTFGGVFPRACADALAERSALQTEVLLDTAPPAGVRHAGGTAADGGSRPADATRPTGVAVRVRFLHVVDRAVFREGPAGPEPVDELAVDGQRHVAWQEATEREVTVRVAVPDPVGTRQRTPWHVPAGTDREPLVDAAGRRVGTLVRSWHQLTGTVEVATAQVADGVHRLTVRIENTTPCPVQDPGARNARDAAAGYALVSTHTLLRADTGRFVSLLDPPPRLRAAAAGCRNVATWPVLVDDGGGGAAGGADAGAGSPAHDAGTDGAVPGAAGGASGRMMLSSPVTLYDFPTVAPESPGDLFDGTEIDHLLVLSVLSLTDAERQEARACDPRAREILDRCAALGPEQLAALRGAVRSFRPLEQA